MILVNTHRMEHFINHYNWITSSFDDIAFWFTTSVTLDKKNPFPNQLITSKKHFYSAKHFVSSLLIQISKGIQIFKSIFTNQTSHSKFSVRRISSSQSISFPITVVLKYYFHLQFNSITFQKKQVQTKTQNKRYITQI